MKPSLPPFSSVPPAPERRIGTTATSLSALAHSQTPEPESSPPPSSSPDRRDRRLGRYVALGAAAAAAVLGAAYLYGPKAHVKPVFLHGTPGVRHTSDGRTVRWRATETTVYIDASVDRLGPKARDSIRNAFGAWLGGEARLPRLTFDTTTGAVARLKADGKNTVMFAPITIEGHERDLAITITYSDEKSGNVVEADVIINAVYSFDFLDAANAPSEDHGHPPPRDPRGPADRAGGAPGSAAAPDGVTVNSTVRSERHSSCVAQDPPACQRDVYDLENVLTHEAGHFFGLGEDMTDTSATMYLCTNRCETHKRELTSGDTAALASLYPATPTEAERNEEVGCGGARLASGRAPAGSTFALLLAASFAAHRRSRSGRPRRELAAAPRR